MGCGSPPPSLLSPSGRSPPEGDKQRGYEEEKKESVLFHSVKADIWTGGLFAVGVFLGIHKLSCMSGRM